MADILGELRLFFRELLFSYRSLNRADQDIVFRLCAGGAAAAIFALFAAWQVVVPILLLAVSVVAYLRFTRDKDGL